MTFFSVGKPDSSEVVSLIVPLTVPVCLSEMKKKNGLIDFLPFNKTHLYKLKDETNTVTATMLVSTLVHAVVQFYPWFNFYFPLFLGMVIYDNEFETKENKN